MSAILKRTTFVCADAERLAGFYSGVFGFERWYDNRLEVDGRFPPVAPDGAPARLIILKLEDPLLGMLGLLQYLDPVLDFPVRPRDRVRPGDTVLVFSTDDLEGACERAASSGGKLSSGPVRWNVPSHDGGGVISLEMACFFDPEGNYCEVSRRRR